jgi:hypothetical protein
MDKLVNTAISEILIERKDLLRIPIRQKAKFEGWLKFELAHYLEKIGMQSVEVETKVYYRRDRTDITFMHDDKFYSIELKTPNTNWKIEGVRNSGRPITNNIKSIIDDAVKLNSTQGIVAFVLFPLPQNANNWETYIERIALSTGIGINRETNCRLIELSIDNNDNKCNVLVCTFLSRKLRDW